MGEKLLIAANHDIKAAEVAHRQMLKALPKLSVLRKAMSKESREWEKQDWLLAWIIIEANEAHAKATFRMDKLASTILPLHK